jgi:hypothetical protein
MPFEATSPGRPRPPHFHFDVTVGRSSAEGIVEDNVTIDMADAQLPAFGSVTAQAAEHRNSDRRDHPMALLGGGHRLLDLRSGLGQRCLVLGCSDDGGDRLAKVVGDSVGIWERWLVEEGGGPLLADQGLNPKHQQGAGSGPGEEEDQASVQAQDDQRGQQPADRQPAAGNLHVRRAGSTGTRSAGIHSWRGWPMPLEGAADGTPLPDDHQDQGADHRQPSQHDYGRGEEHVKLHRLS